MVEEYPLVNTALREAKETPIRYPMAGMKSHEVKVLVYDSKTDKTIELNTRKDNSLEEREAYLTNLTWNPEGTMLYIQKLNRKQNDLSLVSYDVANGNQVKELLRETNEKYVPYVIEPSLGADRVTLAFLVEAYDEEAVGENDTRVVLHFHPALAPVKAAVLPLSKKLGDKADEIYEMLSKYFNVEYDDAGSIGKRYRRQDEIGTPFCITYDFDSVEDGCVTVRDRDTMEQERVKIEDLEAFLDEKLAF